MRSYAKIKRGLGTLGTIACLMSLLIPLPKATAGTSYFDKILINGQPEEEHPFREVFGFEGWTDGVWLFEESDTAGYAADDNNAFRDGFWRAQVAAEGPDLGQALKWVAQASNPNFLWAYLNLATDATAVTDWSTAEEVWRCV